MAANTSPIFIRTADIQWGATDGNGGSAGPLKTANTAKDGTGTVLTVFTADATEGGMVRKLIAKPCGTNVASVLRLFINNGSTNATLANNTFIQDVTLPAITNSEVQAQVQIEIVLDLILPAGYKLNVVLGTTVSAGWQITAVGGKL